MKIYNKKGFAVSILLIALGVFDAVGGFVADILDVKAVIVIAALFAFGFVGVKRSLSEEFAREDKIEECDERNRLIELKSKSMTLRVTQILSFALMLGLMVMGKVSGEERMIAMGVGLAFAFGISMFAEVFTFLYYESRS